MTETRRPLALVLGACAILFAGCGARTSPVQPILSAASVEIGGQDQQVLTFEAPPESPILITISGRDVDVRAALVNADGTSGPFADAPNRRMGIETMLVESPHEGTLVLRIERNDHAQARGPVTVDAVALPVANEADKRRLEAARFEAKASLHFSDVARGKDTAAAYAAAAKLFDENDEDRSAGIALLHAAGTRYLRLSDWQGAADLARRAGGLLEGSDAPALAAYALRVEGAALDQLAGSLKEAGDQDETVASARKILTEAAVRFSELGMPYEAGYALNYRGVSYLDHGDRERAHADFEQALEQFRTARDQPAQALSLQSLAVMNHENGRLADAVREFDEALALIPRDTDLENYAHTLHNSALPLQVLGRFDEAIARFYEAGQILKKLGDRDGQARALHSLGTTLRYAGEPARAKELLGAAIKLRGETGARREQAVSMFVLGQIELEEGNIDAAIAIHKEALGLVTAPNDRAQALLWLAQDCVAANDIATARLELEEILKLGLPETHRFLGLALTELGTVESIESHESAANDAFARAIKIHMKNGSELEQARALFRRADAAMRMGDTATVKADTSAALKLFNAVGIRGTQAESRAAFRATYRGANELRIAALLADAEAAKLRGDGRESQQLLRVALATSDRYRALLLLESDAPGTGARDVPPELLIQRREVYELIAGKRQRKERLLEAVEPDVRQIEALSTDISLLRAKATLIEDRLAKSSTDPAISATPAEEELNQLIPAGEQVAEYFLGDKNSWLFEIRDGVVTVHPLPARAKLEDLARQLHVSWQSASTKTGDRLAAGRKLAAMLYGSLETPRPATPLLIIPDGALHLVPMALLAQMAWPQMQPGTAFTIPSLAAGKIGQRAHRGKALKTLAMIADPVYAANDSRIDAAATQATPKVDAPLTRSARDLNSLQRLPATAIEAHDLLALVGSPADKLALIGADASRENVSSAHLDQYRIVHFATHALADSQDPALATLALSQWDRSGRRIDGALRMYDITQLRLNADLVVLSGCDTALGREISGEGPIGLSQAFLRSGAQAVVSTLWQVPDTSTAVLMREFYKQMLTNKHAAPIALQLAQDYIRKQSRWADPYYWAAFQLISKTEIDRNNNAE